MAEPTRSRFLPKMLERLYAAMTGGPSLHCRPQNSRQRIDLCALACLDGPQPQEAIGHLLGDAKAVKYAAPLANRKLEEPPPTSQGGAPEASVSQEKTADR